MHVIVPRRHSARTFSLLLFYYGTVGAIGVLAAIVAGSALAFAGLEITSEHFAVAFVMVAPIGLVAALDLWHRYVRPRIKFDREQAIKDFDRHYGAP